MQLRRPNRVLGASFLVASAAIFTIGHTIGTASLVAPFIFIAGFCVSGTMVGVTGVVATYYPTASRATWVCWASAVERIGSMFGSATGGYLLACGLGFTTLFMCVAIPALVAAVCMWMMPMEKDQAKANDALVTRTEHSSA